MRHSLKRRIIRMSTVIAVILVAATLFVLGCQRSVLYPRHVIGPPPLTQPPADAERLAIRAGQGEVEAWLFRPLTADDEGAAPLLVFFHGNAELIDHNFDWLRRYRQWGYATLLVEYRGYGRSAGSPSQKAIVADALQFIELATAKPDIAEDLVIVHGRSLGGGVACAVAAERGAKAIILESAFTSVPAVAWSMGIPGFLALDRYDNKSVLGSFEGPVLLMHGRHDEVIAYRHAEANHAAAENSVLVTFESHHNTMLQSPEDEVRYWESIKTFLRENNFH